MAILEQTVNTLFKKISFQNRFCNQKRMNKSNLNYLIQKNLNKNKH